MKKTLAPHIKRILYATDLSKNSAYAFGYAVDLAKLHDAKIIVTHVFEPLQPIVRFHSTLKEEQDYYLKIRSEATENIRAGLDRFCKKVDVHWDGICSELISKILLPIGHPVEEILNVADEEECDLIVMAAHGKGLLKQTFLGSVSKGVIERSQRPVLTVPLTGEAPDWCEI